VEHVAPLGSDVDEIVEAEQHEIVVGMNDHSPLAHRSGTDHETGERVFSPEWFFDFYLINGYADCQTFVCTFPFEMQGPWRMRRWQAFAKTGTTGSRVMQACTLGIT
jgi:hypothetical protein